MNKIGSHESESGQQRKSVLLLMRKQNFRHFQMLTGDAGKFLALKALIATVGDGILIYHRK